MKSTIDKSTEQEKFVADFLEVKRTPRSGATIHKKGDVQDEFSIFECKTSMKEKESFTVKKEWLTKLNRERIEDRKRFAFLIENYGGDGNKDNHVIMSIETFKQLYSAFRKEVYRYESGYLKG